MKDRTREAVFNLLGPTVAGKHAIDLFAGTGALALEAISRGAARATLVEMHGPTAAIIRQNIATLGIEPLCELVTADTFRWWRRRPDLGPVPWVVFCSPPYALFVDRQEDLLELLRTMLEAAPAGSLFAVESDERFDFGLLPDAEAWDLRRYLPALVGIYEKPEAAQ
jgi:16S rRNA (guanine966-N2)-methyltransferase